MKMRKALAILMAIAMVFCYMPVSAFADVAVDAQEGTSEVTEITPEVVGSALVDMPKEGFWSTAALEAAVNNGLLKGFDEKDGTYIRPNDSLTRAQMATIVNRSFGAMETASLSGVADVSANAWYFKDMQKAVKMGTMKLDTNMRPNDNITREEAFTILGRALKMGNGTKADLAGFSDASQVASWAVSGMGAMVKAGYIKGDNNLLTPTDNMTRAQFAVIMDNVVKGYVSTSGTVTEVISGNLMINVPGVELKDVTITGDLIIGEGVGDGTVTLTNVVVKGNLIARGGGVESIIITGGSVEGRVIIAKIDGKIRVFAEGGAEISVVEIDDGKDDVIIEGIVGTVEVKSGDTPVIMRNATVTKIEMNTEGAGNLTVDSGSKVGTVSVNASATGTKVNVAGTVTNFDTSAKDTGLSGTGTVTNAKVNDGANGTSITTPKTVITNAGATGVTGGGGTAIAPNATGNNDATGTGVTPPNPGGSSGGTPVVTVAVSAISVDKTVLYLDLETTTNAAIIATVSPGNATNKNVTWSSSDETKVTVDANGNVAAVAAGTATITATTVDGGLTATITINVIAENTVAMIGTTQYTSLQDAVGAVIENGTASIKLVNNVTLTERVDITSGKSITLDLNGKTISKVSQPIRVSGGTLNVTGTGIIEETGNDGFAPIVIKGSSISTDTNYSNVTIGENVTLKGWAGIFIDQVSSTSPYAYGVKVTFNGTIMSPADTNHDAAGHGIYVNGNIKHKANSPVITIGETAKINTDASISNGIYAAGYANWTIEAGAVIKGATAIEIKAGKMTINGGTFTATQNVDPPTHTPFGNGTSTSGYALAAVNNPGYGNSSENPLEVVINNGTFEGSVQILDDDSDTANNFATLTIKGGTFTDLPNAVEYAADGAIIKLDADTSGDGIVVPEGKNFTLDLGGNTYTVGGETVGSSGTETNGFQLLKDSDITIKNGAITTTKAKILIQNYSNLTLDNVALSGADATLYVLSNNNGTTTLTNGTTITATVGNVAFDVYYWPTAGYQTVSVEILTTDVAINGNVEYASDGGEGWAENASLTIPMDYSLTAPEGFVWVAEDDKEVLTKAEVVGDKVGLLAALADNTITAIVLSADIVLDSTLDIADKTITLDLNGHKLSTPNANGTAAQTVLKIIGTSNVTIQGNGLIQSGTTSSKERGGLDMTPTIHINNDSSSLTIKNSAVIKGGDAINSDDTAPAIWAFKFNELTITGATIRGGDHIKKSGITIGYNNYSIAGHALELMVASGKTVNITNSTISGGNGINEGYEFNKEDQGYMQASGGQAFSMNQSNTINITDSIIEGGDSALHHGGHAIAVNNGVFNIINSNIVGGDGNTYWEYSVGKATSGTGTYNIDASSTTADGVNSNQ